MFATITNEAALATTALISRRARRFFQDACTLVSVLLAPLSFIAYVFGVWRLTSDIGWSGPFAISAGFFSHWIVWFTIGFALSLAAYVLRHRPAAASTRT